MSCDVDWGKRLCLLMDLMVKSPTKAMRTLQAEALKYYPLESTEAKRRWLSQRTAARAADELNKRQGLTL